MTAMVVTPVGSTLIVDLDGDRLVTEIDSLAGKTIGEVEDLGYQVLVTTASRPGPVAERRAEHARRLAGIAAEVVEQHRQASRPSRSRFPRRGLTRIP